MSLWVCYAAYESTGQGRPCGVSRGIGLLAIAEEFGLFKGCMGFVLRNEIPDVLDFNLSDLSLGNTVDLAL